MSDGTSRKKPGEGDQAGSTAACGDPSYVRPTDLRRLTRRELANTYQAAFGPTIYAAIESSVALLGLADEIRQDPGDVKPEYASIQLDAIDRISRRLATAVTESDDNLKSVAGDCSVANPPDGACVDAFIARLGKALFRRPVSADEVALYKDVFGKAASPREGFGDVVTVMTLAPDFLYHVEVGTAEGDATQFKLTNYEIAERIAYATTDSPPDGALMAAADDGSISDPAVAGAQVDRLLDTDAGHAKVLRFVNYWLLLDKFQGLPTSKALLGELDTNGLTAEMRRELDQFVTYVTFEKKGSFKDLLTSRRSFAQTPALAQIYGQPPLTADSKAEVSTDDAHMGLLLRSPILANGANVTHPIVRGTFMLRRIVCNEIPSPSAQDLAAREAANFVPDPTKYTTAEMVAQQTSPPGCQKCHAQINPFGFSLEGFDNIGRARTVETMIDPMGNKVAEHPVSTTATVAISANSTANVTSAPDLINALVNSDAAPMCFTRHVYRFYEMQRETTEETCQLTSMLQAMQEPNGSILQNIKAAIVNGSLNQRRIQ